MAIFYMAIGFVAAMGLIAAVNLVVNRMFWKSLNDVNAERRKFEAALLEHQREILAVWQGISNILVKGIHDGERK